MSRLHVGIIIFHEDQSNTHQGLKSVLDGVAKANGGEIPVTIGNEPGDFQMPQDVWDQIIPPGFVTCADVGLPAG